ncbi:hypothetical protein [Brevundimonas subvibrioides]|uniref:hypothetical protein n=1 Tax=Brevundimonas subvibrioides TaxID=74313 RepID=UPI0022B4E253|nr:hypothetical protein [Brevundimonas subvibrioides]
MTFSATDAAFEGFRMVRRHPLAVVFWAALYLVFLAAFFGVFGSSLASFMAATETLKGTEPTPAELESLSPTLLGLFALAAPAGLLLGAILNAAVARAVVRPQDKAFGYLRLGSDELRVLAVTVVMSIVFGVGTMVVFTVVGICAGLASGANAGLGWLVGIVLGLGAVAAIVWMMVRLSLAVPVTVAERRISLFDSFALTKGHALSLLGMGLIAFIMSILVGTLMSVVAWPLTMTTGGLDQLAALDGSSTMDILRAAGPAIAVFVVVNAVVSALQQAVLYAPFSAAYLGLKGLPQED